MKIPTPITAINSGIDQSSLWGRRARFGTCQNVPYDPGKPFNLVSYFINQNPIRVMDEETFRSMTSSRLIASDEAFNYLGKERLTFEKYRIQDFNSVHDHRLLARHAVYSYLL